MNARRIAYVLASSFLCCALLAHAQSFGGTSAPVQFTLAPENPGPNAIVDISVAGVGSFLGDSNITWQVNGRTELEGTGERDFTFRTGALGTPVRVSVTIQSSAYGTITHQWTFNPSRIDLVWDADTTVPPFFEGRALPSSGSTVTVSAFPEVFSSGKAVAPSALSFEWKLDDTPQPDQSGRGRNTFTFTANELHRSADVSVTVNSDNASVGEGEAVIPFVAPFIALYVHDPLRGVLYNQALTGSFAMPAVEETLHAEPFYFSPDSFTNGSLSYDWQLNNNAVSGPGTQNGELTVRQNGAGQGQASLSVALQNSDPAKLLQAAQSTLTVSFGNQAGDGLFFGL